ncbi:MAG: helix-turn-helix domain-containing protein [Treponema sp.]|jgi:transcriptional regulator with XRE-family HTH domain|nr:helix-turn-helix domain-containing protein [Treponema sp.]
MLPNVSDNLRIILNELNMSQLEFAKSVGTSSVYISMVVNSKRTSISHPLALLIEEKYGYSADWILYNEGEKKTRPFKTQNTYRNLKTIISQLSYEDTLDLLGYILFLEKNEAIEKSERNLKKQNPRSA